MGRRAAVVLVTVLLIATACGSEGVSQTEHDSVVSELTLANQELTLAQEEVALTIQRLTSAEQRITAAIEDRRAAEERADELQDRLDELFTIDASEEDVMERQQALGVLGTLVVEFRNGPWGPETVEMFNEFVPSTGDEGISRQLQVFADAVAVDPGGEVADYEYGILGYEIMAALEREIVDPFGR